MPSVLITVLLAVCGCGDSEANRPPETSGDTSGDVGSPPDVTLEDAGRIAATINAVRDGFASGDGEAVCEALTERGQQITLRFAQQAAPPIDAASCDEAVAGISSSLNADARDEFRGPRDYTAEDVDVDPTDDPGFHDSTDKVPAGGPRVVQVDCLEGDGNVWFAVHQSDGSWKLGLPFCSGR